MAEAGSRLRLDVQGLRAIAVALVWAYHAGLPVPGGFTGVDVFFVISGFVIASSLLREQSESGRIDVRRFFLRRFWRLAPALSLMLVVVMALTMFLVSPLGGAQDRAAWTAVGGAVALGNVVIQTTTGGYFGAEASANPLLHVWSLGVEEQVYLVLPILALLVARATRRWRSGLLVIVTGASVVSFLAPIVGREAGIQAVRGLVGFYSPLSRWWEFAVGIGLAVLTARRATPTRRVGIMLSAAGGVALVGSALGTSSLTPWPGGWTMLPVLGTAALILAGGRGPIGAALSSRPLVAVGDRSYSIYLWHWPLIVLVDLLRLDAARGARLAAAVASLPIAMLAHRLIETPLRRVGRHEARRRGRAAFAAVVVLLPVLAGLGVLGAAERGLGPAGRVLSRFEDVLEVQPEVARGCFSRGPFDDGYVERCTWDSEATGTSIYLVGDSNAAQFSPAVIDVGRVEGRPVVVLTTPSCPPLLGAEPVRLGPSEYLSGGGNTTEYRHCAEFTAFWSEFLVEAEPGVVVLASFDQYWWDPSVGLVAGDGSEPAGSKLAVLEAELGRTVRAVMASGHAVVLVQTIPTFRNPPPAWRLDECSSVRIWIDGCAHAIPEVEIEAIQAASRAVIRRVATATGVAVVDPRSDLCEDGTCSPVVGDVVRYRDATHLTVATSRTLRSRFAEAIETVGR